MKFIFDILLLPAGLLILIKGADWLVEGAAALAKRLGLSSLVIGLTVVAMGTSAPEVAASIAAALADSGDIAAGNVYGSNIANLALVGGMCALIRPITVHTAALFRDLPIMIGSALLLFPALRSGRLERGFALMLIICFIGFLFITIRTGKKHPESAAIPPGEPPKIPAGLITCIVLIAVGLLALALGARMTIYSASIIGKRAGLSEAFIGLTIVAIGTSLPELLTCLVASFRGHDDLSIGNLVGSNIFNTLLVLGSAGLVRPFTVSTRFVGIDYGIMIAVSILFAAFAIAKRKISRTAGLLLTLTYIAFIIFLIIKSP